MNAVYEHNKLKLPNIEHTDPFPKVPFSGYVKLYNLDSFDEDKEFSQKFSFYIMTYFEMNLS